MYGFTSGQTTLSGGKYFLTSPAKDTADNVKIFDRYGNLKAKTTLAGTDSHDALVMKQAGLQIYMMTGQCCWRTSPKKYYHTVSESAGLLALALFDIHTTSISVFYCNDHDGTVYIFCGEDTKFFRADITNTAESALVTLSGTTGTIFRGGGRYSGSYVIGKTNELYRVAEGTLVKTHSMAHSTSCEGGVVDNLNSNKYFLYTTGNNKIYRIDMSASTTTAAVVSSPIDLSSYSPTFNKVINFSYYQYLIAMPANSNSLPSYLFFISKTYWYAIPASTTFSIPSQKVRFYSLAGTIDDTVNKVHWFMFSESATKNVQMWKLSGGLCLDRDASDLCKSCLSPYYAYSTTCYLDNALPASVGPDPISMMGLDCSDGNCLNCKGIYTTCTACKSGYYLYNNACYLQTALPPQVGVDPGTGIARVCAQAPVCLSCQADYNMCTACATSNTYVIISGVCIIPLPGTGYNLGTGQIDPCLDRHCKACVFDYSLCTACDSSLGFSASGGSCRDVSLILDLSLIFYPQKSGVSGIAFLLELHNFADRDMTNLFTYISSAILPTITLSDPHQKFTTTYEPGQRSLLIIITLTPPSSPLLTLNLSYPQFRYSQSNIVYSSRHSLISTGINRGDIDTLPEGIVARMVRWTVPTVHVSGRGQPLWAIGVYSTLIALDPTGTFFRFTKTLQILSKLYFININYGKRLSDFLWWIHHTPEPDEARNIEVCDSRVTRGKLTYKKVALNYTSTLSWQVYVYLSSSIIALLLSHYYCHSDYPSRPACSTWCTTLTGFI